MFIHGSNASLISFHHEQAKRGCKTGVPRGPAKKWSPGTKSAQDGKLDGTCGLSQGPRIILVLKTVPNYYVGAPQGSAM